MIVIYFTFSLFQQQELSSKVFAHLCEVVDDDKEVYDVRIREVSKLIILEGIEVKTSQTYSSNWS